MLKIILSLLIFTIMPINTMLKSSLTFDDIPTAIIHNEIFPMGSQKECEFLTLIKKFGLKEYSYESGNNQAYTQQVKRSRQFIKLALTNLVTLIRLSQTNNAYYKSFNDEIKKRFLSHVSCDSIVTYFDHQCRMCDKIICHVNCGMGMHIFCVEGNNPQAFRLMVNFTNNSTPKIYDESDYININQLYTNIIKNVSNQKIRDLCKKLQEECTITRTMRLQDFDLLKKLLVKNMQGKYAVELNKYSSSAALAHSIILRFTIGINNEDKFKNIIDRHSDNEYLLSIFSKYNISALNNNLLTTYWHSYYSFLQKQDLITWDSLKFNPEYCLIEFSANCGFSNEPTIPVDIISPKSLVMKDK